MFKIGSIIFVVVDIVLILFGLIYAIRADLLPYHIEFIGQSTYDTIASTYPNAFILTRLSILLIGFMFLSLGAAFIIVWYYALRKGIKWAWVLTLVSGALLLIPLMVVIVIVAGVGFPFPIGLIALILWASALVLTSKDLTTTK